MIQALVNDLNSLYADWLMDEYPEEITGSDGLLKLSENQTYLLEFLKAIKEEL